MVDCRPNHPADAHHLDPVGILEHPREALADHDVVVAESTRIGSIAVPPARYVVGTVSMPSRTTDV